MIVEEINAAETLPLRSEILRPGKPRTECVFVGDTDPATRHFGAKNAKGEVIGVASVYQKHNPSVPAALPFQIRGMAVSPKMQQQGVGQILLQALEAYVQTQQGDAIWANARSAAVGFYEQAGYKPASAEFEIAGVGPHFVVAKRLLGI